MGKIKFHHFWPSWKNLGKFREYPPWKNPSHAHALKESVCYDAAKIIEAKLDNTQCGFCRGRSTTEEISTLQQIFQEILGTCQSLIHTFCRPRENIWPGSPWKAWGWCCGSTVLTGVYCWPSSNCILVQKIVSLSTEFTHSHSVLVLGSKNGVCCHHSSS